MHLLALGTFFAWVSGDLPGDSQRRPMPEPPYVLMYGFSDASLPRWTDTFDCVNIITGMTEDADLVRDLRVRGVMFAYHVIARAEPGRETAEELADYWCDALENDLDGELPGGFDAIAIDEIGSPDGSGESARICTALKLTRERCPDRRVFVWGGWRLGEGGGGSRYVAADVTYDDELRAVYEYADLLLYERYIREGNPQFYNFVPSAENLARRVPGMLGKTIYGLYISQSKPFVGDDSDRLDFKDFLDEQFHMFANEPILTQTPGIAFWPFYRAKADTIAHVDELIRHYYQGGRTDYYGDGDHTQIVQNPGFEDDGVWGSAPGTDGSVEVAEYAGEEGVPDKHDPASHGKRCLKMVRGRAANEARQVLALKPDTWYTLTAYCFLSEGQGTPTTHALGPGGEGLQTQRGQTEWDPWLTPVITFRTDADGETTIVLSDEAVPEGHASYWDFVEIEQCRGLNRPTELTRAELDAEGKRILLHGRDFMPGSMLQLDEGEPVPITWHSPYRASIAVPETFSRGEHTLRLKKPDWCLHPHEAVLTTTL